MNTATSEDKRSLESLSTALARTATHLAAEQLPAGLWARIDSQLASPSTAPSTAPGAAPRRPRVSLRAWWGTAFGALAAAGVAGLVSVSLPPAGMPVPDVEAPMSGFLSLTGGDRLRALEGAGSSNAWIVPTELRRADLASLGLPFDPSRAGDSIPAELLVQASGDVIAVRLLPRH